MQIKITFPHGKRVNAEIGSWLIPTDQPVESGGENTAPSPFDYFLASLGTCAGIYVLSFCQQREIDTHGLELTQRMEYTVAEDGKRRIAKVFIEIHLPKGFPEKYINAVEKAAGLCAVKKAIMEPPEFEITAQLPQHQHNP